MKFRMTRMICALLAALAVAAIGSTASAIDYDATFGAGNNAKIARVMLEGLLDESARIIKEAYGIDGRSNNKLTVMWDDDPRSDAPLDPNAAAAAGGSIGIPRDTQIFLSSRYFSGAASEGQLNELRLTVLHEMVHGMQFTSDPGLMGWYCILAGTGPNNGGNPIAQFLIEGMAEYAGAGNRRILSYARKRRSSGSTDAQIVADIIREMPRTMGPNQGYKTTAEMEMYYIVSYLATRWYDSQSKAHGGTGVKGLIEYLEGYTGRVEGPFISGVFDKAVAQGSNKHFDELSTFSNSMVGAGVGSQFYQFVQGVINEDADVDAGRIGGYYAEGKTAKTLSQLLKELSDKAPAQYPLSTYGFDEVTIFGKTSRMPRTDDGGGTPTPPGGGDSWVNAPAVDTTVHTGSHNAAVQDGIAGAGGKRTITFTPTSTVKTLAIKIDVDLSKLVSVAVNGKALTRGQDYRATSGSTVIEFTEAYLASLAEGTPHAVSVKFVEGGTVGTAELFIVKTSGSTTPPDSSGSGSGGGCAIGAGAALAMAFAASRRRMRR